MMAVANRDGPTGFKSGPNGQKFDWDGSWDGTGASKSL